jgi:ArsR family transcriptional regulator, arsenate/arsenite/antimonite-responsive transcriptional repressor
VKSSNSKKDSALASKQVAKIAKALSDETRLEIYHAIAAQEEMNCGEICALQVVRNATVSHHLRVLAEANLIESRRQGQFIYYRAIPGTLADFNNALTKLANQSTV